MTPRLKKSRENNLHIPKEPKKTIAKEKEGKEKVVSDMASEQKLPKFTKRTIEIQ